MKKLILTFVLTLAIAGLMASTASATTLQLSIVGFGGAGNLVTGFNSGSTQINGMTAGPFGLICIGANAVLCGTTASFSSGPAMTSGVSETLVFGPTLSFVSSGPWVVSTSTNGSSVSGLFTLTGTFMATGFDNTPGLIAFTAQENGTTIGANDQLTWSAQGNTVPEPTSLALLGSALVGIGTIARRRFLNR